MVTVSYTIGQQSYRIAIDLGVEASIDTQFHERLLTWFANNKPQARILGYTVYPSSQKTQWEEMRGWLALVRC